MDKSIGKLVLSLSKDKEVKEKLGVNFNKPLMKYKTKCYIFLISVLSIFNINIASGANLVANSSFELGKVDWSLRNDWAISDEAVFKIDNTTAAAGERSLFIQAPPKFCWFRAVSRLFDIRVDKSYVLSVFLRTKEIARVKIGLHCYGAESMTKEVEVGSKWKRYILKVQKMPACTQNVAWVEIEILPDGVSAVPLWIDGAQVEEGEEVLDYKPKELIGLSVTSRQEGNIFGLNEPVELIVTGRNDGLSAAKVKAEYSVVDYFKKVVGEGEFVIDISPNQLIEKKIVLPLKERGYFKSNFKFKVEGEVVPDINVTFAKMVKQNIKEVPVSSPFGMHAGPIGDSVKVSEWAGMKWLRGMGFDLGEERKDEYAKYARRRGVQLTCHTHIFPGYEGNVDVKERFSKIAVQYAKFWEETAKKYNDCITAFEVANEVYMYLSPEDYVYIHKVAYDAVKRGNPKALVIANVLDTWPCLNYLDEFLRLGGGNYCDAISLHPYDFIDSPESAGFDSIFETVKEHIKKIAGKELSVWITEMNWIGDDDYSDKRCPATAGLTKSWLLSERKATDYSARSFFLALSEGVEKYLYHCFNGSMEYELPWLTIHADNTPKPQYVMFGVISNLLFDAKPAGRVGRGKTVQACAFKKGKFNVLVYWHAMEDTKVEGEVTISLSAKKIKLMDIMGNEKQIECKKGEVTLPISSSPFMIITDEVNTNNLLKAFENSEIKGIVREDIEKHYWGDVSFKDTDSGKSIEETIGFSQFEKDSNTKLLLHLDGNTKDTGNNNIQVKVSGNTFEWPEQGKINGGLRLKNVDYLVLPTNVWPKKEGTFEAWVKIEKFSRNQNCLLDVSRLNKKGGIFLIAQRNQWRNHFIFKTIDNLDYNYYSVFSPTPVLNKWYHIAYCWDDEAIRIFINGKLVDTKSVKAGTKVADGTDIDFRPQGDDWLIVGNIGPNGSADYGWNGVIDEIRISDEVRYRNNFNVGLK